MIPATLDLTSGGAATMTVIRSVTLVPMTRPGGPTIDFWTAATARADLGPPTLTSQSGRAARTRAGLTAILTTAPEAPTLGTCSRATSTSPVTTSGKSFTSRQARFLALVLRHSGVCLPRQYATLAGIVHGAKTRVFFHKLVSRGYASAYACRHNRAKLYHVHHAALYGAIHEPNSGYRRPVPAGRVAERLMLLDAILADPTLTWLTSAAEKVAHFTAGDRAVPTDALPRSSSRNPAAGRNGTFPDRLPIGVAGDGRAVLLRLVRPTAHDEFSAFLRRHTALLGALPSWTLRLVLPQEMTEAYTGLQAVIHDEWEAPLHPRTVEELRRYFEQRRAAPNPQVLPSDDRFLRAAGAFTRPRFLTLYKRWLTHGDRVLEEASSTVAGDALAAGHGRVECLVLPHRYEHLSPVLTSAPSSDHRAEKGAEEPDEEGDDAPAPPRPSWANA